LYKGDQPAPGYRLGVEELNNGKMKEKVEGIRLGPVHKQLKMIHRKLRIK
jgi:hypothetical protein